MSQKNEIWKSIDANYSVSNLGNVKNKNTGKILAKYVGISGYERVCLYEKVKKVHRLVAEAFIPNPNNKNEVNHKNMVRTDNHVLNLEWVTRSENIKHGLKFRGISYKGEKNHNSKLTAKDVGFIRLLSNKGYSYRHIAKEYGVTRGCIAKIVRKETWNHL